jgi:hypothetical protein
MGAQIPGDADREEQWEAFVAFALPNGEFVEFATQEVNLPVKSKDYFAASNPESHAL